MRLLRDTWILFIYNARTTLRNPAWVLIGLMQPALYLLLYAPLLNPLTKAPGFPPGGGLAIFTPAAIVMISLYGPVLAGYTLISQLRAGEIERLCVTPVSRLALLLGSVATNVALLIVQGSLLVAVALVLGLRLQGGAGVGLALVMLVLMGVLLASCSTALALVFKNEGPLGTSVQFLSGPLLLLSGILLPLSLAPDWLRNIAAFNPLSYVIDTMRALFTGSLGGPTVLKGFAIIVPLTVLALWWAARSYRKVVA
jgi:ABC-2 type transport system permease protein